MLLTLSQPQSDFGHRVPHDYRSPSLQPNHPRYSPKHMNESSRPSLPASVSSAMSTQHRGLPPPAAMTLPDPAARPPSQMPSSHQLGAMPAPPSTQWQSEADGMRNWLATKAEEERRRQEEEKTRQESLRLEQRRVEQAMLRESMQGGIPPHMVPMIFAGIGGTNLANASLEMIQQYTAQLQAAHAQVHSETSPDSRRDPRSIHQPLPHYALQPHQVTQAPPPLPPTAGLSQPVPPMVAQQTTFSAYQPPSPPGRSRAPQPGPDHRSAAHSALPRLTTGDMQIHQPPTAQGSTHPLQQTQTHHQEQQTSSPSIYFHHWVPPTADSKSNNQPQTPVTGPGGAHLSEGEYASSPRKRKNQNPHQPVPPPPGTGTASVSPNFPTTSSGKRAGNGNAHARSRSNVSKEGDASARHTPARRDSGVPKSQADFIVNEQRARARATSSPKREFR